MNCFRCGKNTGKMSMHLCVDCDRLPRFKQEIIENDIVIENPFEYILGFGFCEKGLFNSEGNLKVSSG